MDIELLRIFQFQIQLQSRFVLKAAADIDAAIQRGKTREQVQDIFYGVQNLLNAAANISKALWGSKGKLANQRKTLRDSIGIMDDSPLRYADMRNNYEHFDERLDLWWTQSQHHNYVDMCVTWGKLPMIVGIDDADKFREFNPSSTALTFWGEHFNIKSIVD